MDLDFSLFFTYFSTVTIDLNRFIKKTKKQYIYPKKEQDERPIISSRNQYLFKLRRKQNKP